MVICCICKRQGTRKTCKRKLNENNKYVMFAVHLVRCENVTVETTDFEYAKLEGQKFCDACHSYIQCIRRDKPNLLQTARQHWRCQSIVEETELNTEQEEVLEDNYADVEDDVEPKSRGKRKRAQPTIEEQPKKKKPRQISLHYLEYQLEEQQTKLSNMFHEEYLAHVSKGAKEYEHDLTLTHWFLDKMPEDVFTRDEKVCLLHTAYDVIIRFLRHYSNKFNSSYDRETWYHNQYWLKSFNDMFIETIQFPKTPMELAYLKEHIRENHFKYTDRNYTILSPTGDIYARHFHRAFAPELERAVAEETVNMNNDMPGPLDPYRIKRGDTYMNKEHGSVHHIGIWSSQGNHDGPGVTCTQRQFEFLKYPAVQLMEEVRTNIIRCTMPQLYNQLITLRERYPASVKEAFHGELVGLQTVPCKGVNVNYICGSHKDYDDYSDGHCFVTCLGDIKPGEGGIGLADFMIIFNNIGGSLTHFNSSLIRHWVEDMKKSDRIRLSHVEFCHNRTMCHFPERKRINDTEWCIHQDHSDYVKTVWSHVVCRVRNRNRNSRNESKFLEQVTKDGFLQDMHFTKDPPIHTRSRRTRSGAIKMRR